MTLKRSSAYPKGSFLATSDVAVRREIHPGVHATVPLPAKSLRNQLENGRGGLLKSLGALQQKRAP